MLKVYVISGKNLPAADSNGLSDPYVVIHSVDGNKFRIGTTSVIKQTLNPSWDPLLKSPFTCPYTRARSFLFEIWDKDSISKDDFLGTAHFDLEIHPIGQPVCLDVENVQIPTLRPPKIVVQVDHPQSNFPQADGQPKVHHITASLTYDPPIPFSSHLHPPSLSLIAIHHDSKMLERIVGGMTPPRGIMVDVVPQHVGPTGWTQVIRMNIAAAKGMTIVPMIRNNFYKGTITLNFCGFQKEPKKDNVRVCDTKGSNSGVLLYSTSVSNVDQLSTLGSLIKFTDKYEFEKIEPLSIADEDYMSLAKSFGIDPLKYSLRFNISLGQSYSLMEVSRFHNIEFPKQIKFGLGWSGSKDLDSFAMLIGEDYKVCGEVSGHSKKQHQFIKHMGDATSGSDDKDTESIICQLDKAPPNIKAIAILASYPNGSFNQVQNIYMRVTTPVNGTEKELMYMPIVAKKRQNSLLFAVMYRTANGSWDLFPASKLFEASGSHAMKDYCNEFFEISGIVEDVINCANTK